LQLGLLSPRRIPLLCLLFFVQTLIRLLPQMLFMLQVSRDSK
jgi:hypothetical protein